MANALADVERLWAKKLVHANLCSESFYINDQNRLVLGDFEHVVHERLGTHDMLLLAFYKLLCEREELARRDPRNESSIKETKTEPSMEGETELRSLSVSGLANQVVHSETLSLDLRGSGQLKNDNRKLEKLVQYFLKKKPAVPVDSRRVLLANAENVMPRNLSFKNILSARHGLHARSNRLFLGLDPGFEAVKAHGIPNLKYKSPEYARSGIVSRGLDLWALGCLLYEICYQDILFDLSPSQISDEQLRVYISNFDIEKTERKFQKLPVEALSLFRRLLTRCPFKRVMLFREGGLRESECFGEEGFRALVERVSPIEFGYNKDHQFGDKECFLDSIRYKIGKKFRLKIKRAAARNRGALSGQPKPLRKKKFKSQENGAEREAAQLTMLDGQFQNKTRGQNDLQTRKKPRLVVKKRRPKKKRAPPSNVHRSKIERQIQRLKLQTLGARPASRRRPKKKKRPKPKRQSSRRLDIAKYFKVETRGPRSIKSIGLGKRSQRLSNRVTAFEDYDTFRRSPSNQSRQVYFSGN